MEPRKYQFNNSTVTVIFGNIMESKAAVIASSDDTEINMRGGVSKSILKGGGQVIKDDARKMLPVKKGDVVVSTAGSLEYQKYIFHCMTIGEYRTTITDESEVRRLTIKDCINKCFCLLQALDLDSIAFPCIGAGTAGFPLKDVAKSMAEAIASQLSKTPKTYNVELYLYDHKQQKTETDYIDIFENFAGEAAACRVRMEKDLKYREPDEVQTEGTPDQVKGLITKKEDMKHIVFISYSRKDSKTVLEIYKALEARGINCWIDKNGISGGKQWKEVIDDAISVAKAILFFSSEESNKSTNVLKEVNLAAELDKQIIPIKLDDTPYRNRYDLSIYHHIEFQDIDQVMKELTASLSYYLEVR
jgi:O-acetyl-ADP-ribose deacetylase (regulator of RNase III)